MSMEETIWGAEAGAPRVESVRDRIAIVQPVPDNFYARCSAHQITHCMVCSMKERAAAEPAPTPPASQTGVAQPLVPTPAADLVPEVVQRAQTLANQIETSDRLRKRITALELSLESARKELQASEEARIVAQTALKALVEDDAQENAK